MSFPHTIADGRYTLVEPLGAAAPLDLEGDGRLQSAVGEVESLAPTHRTRQVDRPRIPALRTARDRRPAWKPEPQQLRDLVEGLTRRVVAGLTEQLGTPLASDAVERRMTARHDEPDVGRLEGRTPGRLRDLRRDEMAHEMMHADEGQPPREREGLGEGEPDEQRADQPRPRRDRDPIDRVGIEARLAQRRLGHVRHDAHVVPGGELGDDPTVGGVHALLSLHRARQDLPPVAQDGGGHLIAGALDAEHDGRLGQRIDPRPALRHDPAQAFRRSSASCSALQSMQSSATGRASMRLIEICSPQDSHSP